MGVNLRVVDISRTAHTVPSDQDIPQTVFVGADNPSQLELVLPEED